MAAIPSFNSDSGSHLPIKLHSHPSEFRKPLPNVVGPDMVGVLVDWGVSAQSHHPSVRPSPDGDVSANI